MLNYFFFLFPSSVPVRVTARNELLTRVLPAPPVCFSFLLVRAANSGRVVGIRKSMALVVPGLVEPRVQICPKADMVPLTSALLCFFKENKSA